jgi:hypothetical protein
MLVRTLSESISFSSFKIGACGWGEGGGGGVGGAA